MAWLFLWLGLAFATQVWLSFRVGRSNVALAIATFLIGFPAALYTLFKQRGEADTSVTLPFVANLVFSVLFFMAAFQTLVPLLEAQEAQFDEPPGLASPLVARGTEAHPTSSSTSSSISATASPVPAPSASADAAAPAPLPASDEVDAFATALEAGGLKHSVTRLADRAKLPPGVTQAALFSVQPMDAASVASAASAQLSATLFSCESAAACRNLAGAHLQQSAAERRRVLQNGLLLLSMPPAATEGDLTPAAVASVFRKL